MNKVQIVIPMAGLGSRFANKGYTVPKPLIPIHGTPMIGVVAANLANAVADHLILVCKREVMETTDLPNSVSGFSGRVTVVAVDNLTEGPAATVEAARAVVDLNRPLVIANSDQYVDAPLDSFYEDITGGKLDGAVLCMRDDDPKWSYAQLDQNGFLLNIVEKKVVSPLATVGIYGYAKASYAFNSFASMRAAGDRTNNEYYVGPGYKYLVKDGLKISVHDLGAVSDVMFGLGIPEDLETFARLEVSKRASRAARVGIA